MPSLLLNLRHVPDDESDAVRALLDAHHIDYFETRPSRWGVSAGSIWIRDNSAFADAGRMLDEYQEQRALRSRAEHVAEVMSGSARTLWDVVREEPMRVVLALISITFVLALMALPVFLLSR